MKKTLITLLVVALLLSVGVSAELITLERSLDMSLLNYQPVPAHPGDKVDVWIQIENNGGSASKTGTLTIIDSKSLIAQSDIDRVKEFQSIPARQSFLVKTTIRVAKDAHEGENDLIVQLRETGNSNYIEKRLPITIQGKSSALSIVSAVSTPEQITPGGVGQMAIKVKNIGDSRLRNIKTTLDFTGLSMAPTGSSSSQTIDSLNGGEEYTYHFTIVTYPDAATQAYRIPILISYQDETGTTVTQNETVGIVIGAPPELLIYFEKISATKESKQGAVVIKFVNKGLSEIKLLEMEVVENDQVTVTSESAKVYVGNIATDDYETAELTLHLTKENVIVPLRITYKDSLNQPYEETVLVPLTLRSANGKGGSGWILWLIIFVFVAAATWFFLKSRCKK